MSYTPERSEGEYQRSAIDTKIENFVSRRTADIPSPQIFDLGRNQYEVLIYPLLASREFNQDIRFIEYESCHIQLDLFGLNFRKLMYFYEIISDLGWSINDG